MIIAKKMGNIIFLVTAIEQGLPDISTIKTDHALFRLRYSAGLF